MEKAQRGYVNDDFKGFSIAVAIPCFNEEKSIGLTVSAFASSLPTAEIFVFDNNSTDKTIEVAMSAGAIIRYEPRQGKGFVVRRVFADIEADIVVLVDGDNTYDATVAPLMVSRIINEHLDMVVGVRKSDKREAYRPGHKVGNYILTKLLSVLFGNTFSDILSGYRVFSRRFMKSFPLISQGFEIETEISVHALELALPVGEEISYYKERLVGSNSKLSTYKDGARILKTIFRLVRLEKPLYFFGVIAALFLISGVVLIIPVLSEFYKTGLVRRIPTAVLSMGLTVIAALSLTCGLILSTVVHARQEIRRLAYLRIPSL